MKVAERWQQGVRASGPALWKGPDMARDPADWTIRLSDRERNEIRQALETARGAGIGPREVMEAGDAFPLPSLASVFARIRAILAHGTGFLVLKGLPTDGLDIGALSTMLLGLGGHLGVCVSQNHKGDYVGLVMDQSDEIADPRRYQAGGEFRMHVDPIDIVGLLCARKAKRGGESYIVSTLAVHNAILAERPDLMPALYQGYRLFRPPLDRGDAPALTATDVPMFAPADDGSFASLCLPDPIEQAVRREGVTLSAMQIEALSFLDRVAHREDLVLEMDLEPGDLQLLNNRVTLHGRRDYLDHPERARRRLMLRLWLMMPGWPRLDPRQKFFDDYDRAGGGIPRRDHGGAAGRG